MRYLLSYSCVHLFDTNENFIFSFTGVPPKYHCVRNCGYKTHIHSNLKRHLNSKFCKPDDSVKKDEDN